MGLKLKRKQLERIVYEELSRYISEQLTEAPAVPEMDDEVPAPEDAPEEADLAQEEEPEGDEPTDEPKELPMGSEPADDELEDEEGGDEDKGTLAGELKGKTVSKVTLNDKSLMMPGATELVIGFREVSDALRVLLTKTGKVKFFYKGLHNNLNSPVEQIPGEETEEDDELGATAPPRELFRGSASPAARPQQGQGIIVTDGPQLYRTADGSLHMLWSSWGDDGYFQTLSRSPSGDLFGPWEHGPVWLAKGSGHGMLFRTLGGQWMLVVHRPFKNARGKLYDVREQPGGFELVRQRVDLDLDPTPLPPSSAKALP